MSTTATTATRVPLLVAIAPAAGATGRDKVAGPVVSLGKADHLIATRRPFRTGFRRNEWTGFAGHSVRASLYRVEDARRPEYAPDSVILVGRAAGLADTLRFGEAPQEVRELFRAELAQAIAETPAGAECQLYLVRSYDTPIAWGFHYVGTGHTYAPRIVSRPDTWTLAGGTVTHERHEAENLLTVPDVRYSQTTTQHQGACVSARVLESDPACPLTSEEYHSVGTAFVTVGRRVDAGDPGQVRAGRGGSPFGPRVGY